jgi:hypothetical protein
MANRTKEPETPSLREEWQLTPAATLGSSMRMKGILLEIRAHLPWPARKRLQIEGGVLVLRMPEDEEAAFRAASEVISANLVDIEDLPVIPREVEDILTISSGQRLRWLKDGRLMSAGTRTEKLRGRAKAVTFHVFDPRYIEDVLDRDLPSVWREDDAVAAAENRRRAAGKAALRRSTKSRRDQAITHDGAPKQGQEEEGVGHRLQGWDDFDIEGLLR